MNQTLNDDLLGEIIKWTFTSCTQVCKRWSNIIRKNYITCSTCNKIVKMYGKQIWTSPVTKYKLWPNNLCHTKHYKYYYTYLVHAEIRNVNKLVNMVSNMNKCLHITFTFSNLKNDNDICMIISDDTRSVSVNGSHFHNYYCTMECIKITIFKKQFIDALEDCMFENVNRYMFISDSTLCVGHYSSHHILATYGYKSLVNTTSLWSLFAT